MKKFLMGLVLGAVLFIPGTVAADRVIKTPTTNPIYNIDGDADISVFDDGPVKCYVNSEWGSDEGDISCVVIDRE